MIVLFLAIFLTACETKNTVEDSQNDISNIIIDNAYVILDNAKLMNQYTEYNGALLKEFDIDFRTITTTEDKDINIFANEEFNKLQQKSRSSTGKAILMVINTMQDKVRLEVSMALEPIYTDAFISYIERKGFVPYFRNDTIADAIYMATSLVMDRANDAKVGKEFMPPMESKSIGAGAKTKSHIGVADKDTKQGKNISVSSSDTPKDILMKHLKALKAHNTNPNLDIFSDATKKFFQSWTVTEINQNNEIRFLEPCMQSKEYRYSADRNYATALNHPVKQRECSPYFFKKEKGKWTLDIATMSKVLKFNTTMQWHFDMDKKYQIMGNYEFAFVGLYYDKNGYPHISKNKKRTVKKLRWGYTCGDYYNPQDPEKVVKCWIKWLKGDGAAKNVLGLKERDRIMSVGEGADYIKNVSVDDFMKYMIGIPKGEKATVTVIRDSEEVEVLHSIAP